MSQPEEPKSLWIPGVAKELEAMPPVRFKVGWKWLRLFVLFVVFISFYPLLFKIGYFSLWMVLIYDSRPVIWLFQSEGMQPEEQIRKLSVLPLVFVLAISIAFLALATLEAKENLYQLSSWTFLTPIVALCLLVDSLRQRPTQGP